MRLERNLDNACCTKSLLLHDAKASCAACKAQRKLKTPSLRASHPGAALLAQPCRRTPGRDAAPGLLYLEHARAVRAVEPNPPAQGGTDGAWDRPAVLMFLPGVQLLGGLGRLAGTTSLQSFSPAARPFHLKLVNILM